jgi:four helix bundle protein
MQLARDVYCVTSAFPRAELFGITMQKRRAAVSIPSNIAEGHGRLSDNLLRVFLAQARGSLFELETQTQLAVDPGYADAKEAERLNEACGEVARMLNGLLRALTRIAASTC